MKKKTNKFLKYIKKNDTKTIVIISIIFELIIYMITPYIENTAKATLPLILIFGASIYLLTNNKKTAKKNLFYIIYIISILIRTIYILYTDIFTRQHDVMNIVDSGHLGYIYTLYKTYRLPTTNAWQFYHPPAWHILGAIWLKINDLFNAEFDSALEGIQILSTLFSCFIVLVVDKINIKLKLKDKYRYIVDLMFAVHPTLIMLSGSINNDCLLTFLEYLIVLLLINWYESPTTKNTIKLAIITGLCIMTKANGIIMFLPISYAVVKKIIELRKKKQAIFPTVKRFLMFDAISLVIGFWFQVRNLIKFSEAKIPAPGMFLYTGKHSIISRFFSINIKQLFRFANMTKDYNLPAFIIKSSLFGEYVYKEINLLAKILLVANILLVIISICFMIKYIFTKRKNINMNILIITWLTSIAAMYVFYYKYPYTCSMDFRYIAITLLPGITILGYMLPKIKNKYIKIITELLCYLFFITSIIFVYKF